MRVLVVDDSPDMLTLLRLALQLDGYAVDTAATAAHTLELAFVHRYDVIVLDLNLPDGDGFDVCRQLRAADARVRILVLSGRTAIGARVAALDAGADDYVPKPFDYLEVVARVRALLRRSGEMQPALLTCGDVRLDPATRRTWQGTHELALPRKQFAILEYLLRHRGKVVSQEELLEHVWNAEANPFTNTVRVQVNGLRRALGDTAHAPRYLETVVGVGYRLDDFAAAKGVTQTLSSKRYAAPRRANRPARRITMTTPTILIVDDAPDIARLLATFFHQAGFVPITAATGQEALDQFQHAAPDLLVLDLGLPDIDGLEVCKRVRHTSSVPIVIVTRRRETDERLAGYAAGADHYLPKPFDAEELLAVVRVLLRRTG